MCGIAGIVGYSPEYLSRMLERLQHRGPDHTGQWSSPQGNCHLGHLRLSIIDPDPRSNQPFASACGRYRLTFNGEIYNFVELRQELETQGITFHTSSDTEVLLQWLIRHGTKGLARLEGMFAFGLLDIVAQTLLLARDPIGEKPLYYAHGTADAGRRFAFASEIKGLLQLPDIERSLDQTALLDYLRFLYTTPPETLYRGIRELAPGHLLMMNLNGDLREALPQRYYSLEDHLTAREPADAHSAAVSLRALLEQSVRLRLVSDVDIGLFLSAGLDSNTILVAARTSGRFGDLHTFTLQYSGPHDESETVRRVLARAGLGNVAIPFRRLDFAASVQRAVDLFDQPFGNSTALSSDLIASEAARSCKVCLVGDGGDEVAVGYPRYRALCWLQRLQALPAPVRQLIAAGFPRLLETGRLALPARRARQFLATLRKPMAEAFLDWSTYLNTRTLAFASGVRDCETPFFREMLATFERHADDPVRAATIVDMKSFVPFNLMQSADRTSMAHSLELRSPYLATPLVHSALSWSGAVRTAGPTKALLRNGFPDLPKEIRTARKRAFNPPIREMLTSNLTALRDHLIAPTARIAAVVERDFVQKELTAFEHQQRDNSTLLWGLATLESWLQRRA